ncbi:G-protein coupled receptor GRL101-like [Lytechinus variegatus]|uniref:G-protein coupled receptor GRL101-like n=1 Tax=Lytechinus variegatus TaxID=7654 RepID=UPI001BB2464A|nr:G-protein coupled receptor GRL101-like [Lytechinus variegatus]
MGSLLGILIFVGICHIFQFTHGSVILHELTTLELEEKVTILSPNSTGNNTYPINVKISWLVSGPADTRIVATFRTFRIEPNFDFLTIGFGLEAGDPKSMLRALSGRSLPDDVISLTNQMWLHFVSDSSITDQGFKIDIWVKNISDSLQMPLTSIAGGSYEEDVNCQPAICPEISQESGNVSLCKRVTQDCPLKLNPFLEANCSNSHLDNTHIMCLATNGGSAKDTWFKRIEYLRLFMYQVNIIHSGAFSVLSNLTFLDISNNNITTLRENAFSGLTKLYKLNILNNLIKHIERGAFAGLSSLHELELQTNFITDINRENLAGLGNLTWLYLQNNHLTNINERAFSPLTELRVLYLSNNSIRNIRENAFSELHRLVYLDLSHNQIARIYHHSFFGLANLKYLLLLGSAPEELHQNAFDIFTSLDVVITSDNRICCIFKKNINTTCRSNTPSHPLDKGCEALFPNHALRVAGWILGLSALIGNAAVVLTRVQGKTMRTSPVQNSLLISLATADGLMGMYMLIITSADTFYGRSFFLSASRWRESGLCNLAGFLGFVSCEASVFTLCLITADRLMNITNPIRGYKIKTRACRQVIIVVWFCSIITGITISILQSEVKGFYGLSNVCLGLPLHTEPGKVTVSSEPVEDVSGAIKDIKTKFNPKPDQPVWWFSILTFIFLNLLAFIFITVSYVVMFINIKRSSRATRNTAPSQRELQIARRMAVIIVTDFCCWMPVIMMGILTQTGAIRLQPSVYAWTVIFIIPINSSLNPFIYTYMFYFDGKPSNYFGSSGSNNHGALSVRNDRIEREQRRGRMTELDRLK